MRPNSLVLIIKDGKLLAQKGKDTKTGVSFCRPIGGGIEFQEKSLATAKREIMEELGATLQNEKFLTVVENIFEYNGKPYHEITFLYSGDLKEESFYKMEKVQRLDFKSEYAEWISIPDLKENKIIIYPKECLDFL